MKEKVALVLLSLFLLCPAVHAAVDQSSGVVAVYRLLNPRTGGHYLTITPGEMFSLTNNYGWNNEGIGWYSILDGDPVYSLYNPNLDEHFYTLSSQEAHSLNGINGWQIRYEEAFYSKGDMPIYRLYSPNSLRHHYTADLNEYNSLPQNGWVQEGIAFYGIPESEVNRDYYLY